MLASYGLMRRYSLTAALRGSRSREHRFQTGRWEDAPSPLFEHNARKEKVAPKRVAELSPDYSRATFP